MDALWLLGGMLVSVVLGHLLYRGPLYRVAPAQNVEPPTKEEF